MEVCPEEEKNKERSFVYSRPRLLVRKKKGESAEDEKDDSFFSSSRNSFACTGESSELYSSPDLVCTPQTFVNLKKTWFHGGKRRKGPSRDSNSVESML